VDKPPKIAAGHAREIPIEVLPPVSGESTGKTTSEAPIHALSALLLVAVDSLWTVFDLAPPTWFFAIPLCFGAVFVPVYLIQRHLKQDQRGRALAFAALLATLAAIPTPVVGTEVGLGLLLWTGMGKLLGKALPR